MKKRSISRGYRSFIQAYKPHTGFVITSDLLAIEIFGETKAYFIPFESIDIMFEHISQHISIYNLQ